MLDGTSALVVSGLGAATAAALTAAGASVVIFDRDERRGPIVSKELGCRFHARDITVATDVAAAADAAGPGRSAANLRHLRRGRRGGMVLDRTGRPHDLGLFERTVRINLVGTFNVVRLAAAAMTHNQPDHDGERGVIVTTSSIAALTPRPGRPPTPPRRPGSQSRRDGRRGRWRRPPSPPPTSTPSKTPAAKWSSWPSSAASS